MRGKENFGPAFAKLCEPKKTRLTGDGTLRIEPRSRDGMAELTVRDDGAGMSEETRRRALEPFFTTKEAGIGTSIYYPQPVPRMKYYANRYGYDPAKYPQAIAIADNSIALPVGPHITLEDIDTIIYHVQEVYRELDS